MADDAKIRIPIDIPPGDVSGAEVARQEIAATTQAAESANSNEAALAQQRIDDVAEAKRRASERQVENISREIAAEKEAQQAAQDSARLRLAAGAALAASARQVSALTVEVIQQYRELGVEIGSFETIGLEFADFLTRPFDFVADAFTDYKGDLAALKESQLEVIRQERIYQDTVARRDALLAAASERRINNYLAGEKAGIDEVTAAYERQLQVVDAIAKAEEARAKVADAIALANGADPNQVAAGAAARQAAAGTAAQDQRVADAEREVELAIQRYDALVNALAQAQGAVNKDREKIEQLSADAAAAQAAIGDAQAEVETVRIEAAAAKAEIEGTATAEIQGISTAAQEANTKAAAEAKAALAAQATEQGANFTAGGREALAILTAALADGVISPEEIGAVTVAINQAKGASTRLNADVLEGFNTLEKTNTAMSESIRQLNARLNDQARQMEALRAQISAGN